jgi:enoyl-CoA hydratase/carnithine racemase
VLERATRLAACSAHRSPSLDHAGTDGAPDLREEGADGRVDARGRTIRPEGFQGPAVAGGCHLVATCDLAVASDRASFAVPGLRLGLTGITAMVEVARAAGRKRAMQLLVTGETIDAVTATAWGLVNEAVPHDALDDATARLAANVASASGSVIEDAKRDLFENLDLPLGRAYAHAAPAMAVSAAAPPGREGVAAFLERRAPTWLG